MEILLINETLPSVWDANPIKIYTNKQANYHHPHNFYAEHSVRNLVTTPTCPANRTCLGLARVCLISIFFFFTSDTVMQNHEYTDNIILV